MAPYTFDGHQVYGLFWATATFLSQNFASQFVGVGDAADAGTGPAEAGFLSGSGAVADTLDTPSWADGLPAIQATAVQAGGAGTSDPGNGPTQATDTSPIQFLLANEGAWGRTPPVDAESDSRRDVRHSIATPPDDAV